MAALLCPLLTAYMVVVFGRIILSWFPISAGSFLSGVQTLAYALTEPVLGPLRRAIPAVGFGGMGLDLSPIIVLFGIQILQTAILRCG